MNPRHAILTAFVLVCSGASAAPVALQSATATYSQADYLVPGKIGGFLVSQAIDGKYFDDVNGWSIARPPSYDGAAATANETAAFETATDLGFSGGTTLTFSLYQYHFNPGHNLGSFRISVTTDDRTTFADGLAVGGDINANWTVLHPFEAASTGGAILEIHADGSIFASGFNPATSIYTVAANTSLIGITGIRLEALEDANLPFSGPGRFPGNGNFVLTEFAVDAFATPVPEPSGAAMILLGVAVVAYARRRNLGTSSSTPLPGSESELVSWAHGVDA